MGEPAHSVLLDCHCSMHDFKASSASDFASATGHLVSAAKKAWFQKSSIVMTGLALKLSASHLAGSGQLSSNQDCGLRRRQEGRRARLCVVPTRRSEQRQRLGVTSQAKSRSETVNPDGLTRVSKRPAQRLRCLDRFWLSAWMFTWGRADTGGRQPLRVSGHG
jgi:hypothetical protein